MKTVLRMLRRGFAPLVLAALLALPVTAPGSPARAAAAGPAPISARVPVTAPRHPAVAPASLSSWTQSVLGNRTRMIQVTLVFMALGIVLLMWGKSK